MRIYVHVQLDSGGKVTVEGHDLTAEDVNEVFRTLAGKQVESAQPEKATQT